MTETTEPAATDDVAHAVTADAGASATSSARPRIRSGAIAWGLIVCGIAVTVLLVIGSPRSRAGFAHWLGALTPGGHVLIGVLALGGLILLWGLLGVIHRLQRRRAIRD